MSTSPFATAAQAAPWRANQPGRARPITAADPMPFGKYKGIPIEQVRPDYLKWALDNTDACVPGHDRYWPELTKVLEDLVAAAILGGALRKSDVHRPGTLGLPALCALLAGRGITISARAGELVTSEVVADEELREALRIHKAALLALIAVVEPRSAPGNGSAKLLWAADLRCRIKAWYSRMSRQFHPDRGGSEAGQVAVNQCYQSLMTVLLEWESTR